MLLSRGQDGSARRQQTSRRAREHASAKVAAACPPRPDAGATRASERLAPDARVQVLRAARNVQVDYLFDCARHVLHAQLACMRRGHVFAAAVATVALLRVQIVGAPNKMRPTAAATATATTTTTQLIAQLASANRKQQARNNGNNIAQPLAMLTDALLAESWQAV